MPIVNKESITRIRKNFSCLFENVPSTRCVEALDWTSCKWILRTNIQTFNSFQATGLFLSSLNTWDEWVNPLGANPTKLSNTLKQFVGRLPTNCLNVFEHFVELALKGLNRLIYCAAAFAFGRQVEINGPDMVAFSTYSLFYTGRCDAYGKIFKLSRMEKMFRLLT